LYGVRTGCTRAGHCALVALARAGSPTPRELPHRRAARRNLRPRREYLDSVARSEFRAHGRSLLLSLSGKRTLGMHSTTLDHWGAKVPPSDFLIQLCTACLDGPSLRPFPAARADLGFSSDGLILVAHTPPYSPAPRPHTATLPAPRTHNSLPSLLPPPPAPPPPLAIVPMA